MNNRIAYALIKEIPLPRLLAALESASEAPPVELAEAADKVSKLIYGSEENDQMLRDIARLLVTTPALTSSIIMRSPAVEGLLASQAVSQAIELLKNAGFGALHIAEQKAEHRSPVLSKFLKICQEELSGRS